MRLRQSLIAALLFVASCVAAEAAPYYNSAEAGCDGSDTRVYFCDDFEHNGSGGTPGTWWILDGDHSGGGFADSRNKGWGANIPPTGTGFPNPAGAVRCGAGITPFGNCAAYAGNYGARSFGGGNMAMHRLKTPTCGSTGAEQCNAVGNEIYVRWYAWWDAGYSFGNEKNMNITNYDGDIAIIDITLECGAGSPASSRGPGLAYNYGALAGDTGCGPQNQGNNISLVGGRVYFFELHVKAGSAAVVDLWVNDCGPVGGAFNCGAAPILRSHYTGNLPGNCSATGGRAGCDQIQTVWLENWTGITSTGGGPSWDQMKAMSVGPIGFAGAVTPPSAFGLPGGAGQGAYTTTGLAATLTRLAGPTLIGFVHRAMLAVIILTLLILIGRRTHAPRR